MIKLLELYILYFIVNMHFKEWQLTTWKHWDASERCIFGILTLKNVY